MSSPPCGADNRGSILHVTFDTAMTIDQSSMFEQIEELLNAPTLGVDPPARARIEDTLTDGYARALALEAERLRVERRLGELAREVNGRDPAGSAGELATLSERLASTDTELARLRAVLGVLRDRVRAERAVASR